MLDTLTPEVILTEIIMSSVTGKSILIAEGDSDENFYDKFFDNSNIEMVIAYGKENVESVISTLNKENIIKVDYCAIVDADFDRILGKCTECNIFRTDFHDFEVMIFKSSAFERLCNSFFQKSKIEKYENHDEIRSTILEKLYPLSLLKYLNYKEQWGLNFKNIDISKFLNKDFVDINLEKMFDVVIQNTVSKLRERIAEEAHTEKRSEIQKRLASLVSKTIITEIFTTEFEKEHDLFQLTNGHDIINVFSIGLRKFFAGMDSKVCDSKHIETIFALSYDTKDFERSELYSNICNWQTGKTPILNLKSIPNFT